MHLCERPPFHWKRPKRHDISGGRQIPPGAASQLITISPSRSPRGKNVSIVVTCLPAGGEFCGGSPTNQGPSAVSKNRLDSLSFLGRFASSVSPGWARFGRRRSSRSQFPLSSHLALSSHLGVSLASSFHLHPPFQFSRQLVLATRRFPGVQLDLLATEGHLSPKNIQQKELGYVALEEEERSHIV